MVFNCVVCILCPQEIKITEFDNENFKIKAEGYPLSVVFCLNVHVDYRVLPCRYGETFDLKKHPQVGLSDYWIRLLRCSALGKSCLSVVRVLGNRGESHHVL